MIRRALVVAATVLGVAVVVPAVEAQAIPACASGHACLYQWWADPGRTVFSGYLSINCQGNAASSGTRTRYLDFTQSRCNSSI